MLKHINGNLLDLAESGHFEVILQGCNCFNTMGGGIAREIKERYPQAAAVDACTQRGDYNKLGNYTKCFVPCEASAVPGFTIINGYTQYNMSQGNDVFEYTAFQVILEKIAFAYGDKSIGLPYIGMGLAGGDEKWIIPMIEEFAEKVTEKGGVVTLVKFEP